MEASGTVYARVPDKDPAKVDAAIRSCRKWASRGPLKVLAYDPAAHDFALIDRFGKSDDVPSWSGKHAEADDFMALSRALGDVVAHYDVEGQQWAEFAHWKDGALVRSLTYGDGQWSKVEGQPQAWEAAFFAPGAVNELLDLLSDQPELQAELRAVVAARTVAPGARFPFPSAAIFQPLRGPAFGFRPWPRRKDVVKEVESDAK
jgi:hypothetical protein